LGRSAFGISGIADDKVCTFRSIRFMSELKVFQRSPLTPKLALKMPSYLRYHAPSNPTIQTLNVPSCLLITIVLSILLHGTTTPEINLLFTSGAGDELSSKLSTKSLDSDEETCPVFADAGCVVPMADLRDEGLDLNLGGRRV
jgi:hypothetical protein